MAVNFKKKEIFAKQAKSDYEQKLIDLRRVARVMAGGRRFNFRAAVVIGNKDGKVGFGIGKGADTALAIEKAVRSAKKKIVNVLLTKEKSIARSATVKLGSARIFIKPTERKSLTAGGAVRIVLLMAGVQSASAKIISPSKNKITNARAAVEALRRISEIKKHADS